MLFVCRNLLFIAKKNRCPHLRRKSLSRLYRNDEKRSRNYHPNVLICLFLVSDDIFMKKNANNFFRFPQYTLDSTLRCRIIDKILAKFLQSFIFLQIIAAATIDFLFSFPERPLHKLLNAH